jgi:ribosome-associated protein
MTDQDNSILALAMEALEELKARNIVSLDVRELTSVADTMIVASGTSNRHVSALADNLVEKAKQNGHPPIGVEGKQSSDWVLVDLGDVLVHVMSPATREFYDLERLWSMPRPSRKQRRRPVSAGLPAGHGDPDAGLGQRGGG